MLRSWCAAAVAADAPALADAVVRRAARGPAATEQVADVRPVIDRVAAMPDERIVVAEYDGECRRRRAPARDHDVSPLNLEPVVQAISPHVLPEFRRHGVGTRPDGRGRRVRRGARHRATSPPRAAPAPATPTASWPGSRSGRPRRCGSPDPRVRAAHAAPARRPRRPSADPGAGGPPLERAPGPRATADRAAQPASSGHQRAGDPRGADARPLVGDDDLVGRDVRPRWTAVATPVTVPTWRSGGGWR